MQIHHLLGILSCPLLSSLFLHYIWHHPIPLLLLIKCNYILMTSTFGVIQLYLWTPHIYKEEGRTVHVMIPTWIDNKIPYKPIWTIPYSIIYYWLFPCVFLKVTTLDQFISMNCGFVFCMFFITSCFYIFPNTVPQYFREYEIPENTGIYYRLNKWSENILRIIHHYDSNDNNGCPSGHCTMAMYITVVGGGLDSYPIFWMYPFITALSCLFTKQHVFIDTVLGCIVGFIIGYATIKTY
jgi:membrane-associated phospholipid phosphatase